jgi:hypothetical protein
MAAQRANPTGQRRSKDLLSGKVRCGLCGRIAGVHYNDRNQAIFRCRHRGQGCNQPGRSSNGLHRATVLGLRVLASDLELQSAIRHQLREHRATEPTRGPSASSVVASLKLKERKLLDLYYADKIDADCFAVEQQRLKIQITTLESEIDHVERERSSRDRAANRFEEVAEFLSNLDFDEIWTHASVAEQRLLVEDLVDAVRIFPDRLTVQVAGAPPILVTLQEVGLTQGCKPVVSETGLEPTRP